MKIKKDDLIMILKSRVDKLDKGLIDDEVLEINYISNIVSILHRVINDENKE